MKKSGLFLFLVVGFLASQAHAVDMELPNGRKSNKHGQLVLLLHNNGPASKLIDLRLEDVKTRSKLPDNQWRSSLQYKGRLDTTVLAPRQSKYVVLQTKGRGLYYVCMTISEPNTRRMVAVTNCGITVKFVRGD